MARVLPKADVMRTPTYASSLALGFKEAQAIEREQIERTIREAEIEAQERRRRNPELRLDPFVPEKPQLTRRMFPGFAGDTVWNFEGRIIGTDGGRVNTMTFDPDERLRTDSDPGQRWFSDFLKRADTPHNKPVQERMLTRYETVAIVLAIAFPDLARKYDLAMIED